MGAHPKNKITSVERGKRRAGNTPSLKKDHRITTVPLHKRGLVQSILASIGLADAPKAGKESKKAARKNRAGMTAGAQTERMTTQAAPKPIQRTQHKG
ncbi:hypothetical protein KA082_00890 [Candidatus Woesebacteria bacterium]|nr:hypothetical protein [Candidatus Woesebacteria bacterium]